MTEKILDSGLNHHLAKSPALGGRSPVFHTNIVTWRIVSCSDYRPFVFKTRKTDTEEEVTEQDWLYLT